MLNYSFGIHVKTDNYSKTISYHIGVSNPEYHMLNYLYLYHLIPDVQQVIQELDRVMHGMSEEYSWGVDMCVINSKKDNSVIEYIDGELGWENPQYTELPTTQLLEMMRYWKIFLQSNPQELYLNKKD